MNTEVTCGYRIVEGTKNEYVAVGSDGNILRWGFVDEPQQEWLIYPINPKTPGDDTEAPADRVVRYRIQTFDNEEFMAVGSDGNIRRWSEVDEPAQEFRFVDLGDGWYNIREGTEDEYVTTEWLGNIFRWARLTGEAEVQQKFRLEPIRVVPKPEATTPMAEYGEIADFPNLSSVDELPPRTTEETLVSEEILSALVVAPDPNRHPSKVSQVASNPYYRLSLYQYWDAAEIDDKIELLGRETREYTIETYRGFARSEVERMETVVGHTLRAGVSVTGGKQGKGSATARLEYEYKNLTTQVRSSDTSYQEWRKLTNTIKFAPQGEKTVVLCWKRYDVYRLTDMAGNLVPDGEWRTLSDIRLDSFPPLRNDETQQLTEELSRQIQ